MVAENVLVKLYDGREEAPLDDELYDFTKQRKLADMVDLNCALLEKKLELCNAKTMQGKSGGNPFYNIVIAGAKDIELLESATTTLYVKVKCGEAVFHTHPFEKDATDWASAPMEVDTSEVPEKGVLSVHVMDQSGDEVAQKEVDLDLALGIGFDRWIPLNPAGLLRLQVEHKGTPVQVPPTGLESEIADLISKKRHVQATLQDALPPMAYATYSTMVAEVERRLCSEVEFLRKQLGDKAGSSGSVLRVSEKVQAPLQPAAASVIRVMDTGGAIEVVEQRPGVQYVEERVHTVVEDNTEVTIQTLIATLNGRNKVIRQLQDSLAATAGVDNPAASDTILMLATQLEERETTLAQLKADLPPQSIATLLIDQSNVINTLLSQLHKALGNLETANSRIERLTLRTALFGENIFLKGLDDEAPPILTPEQVAALISRFDEANQVIVARDAKIKELMDILGGMEDNYHDPRDLAPFLQKAGGSLCDQFNQSLNTLSEICYCLEGDPALARGFQEQLPDPVELPESPTLWGMGEALQQVTRKMADAHKVVHDQARGLLPHLERLAAGEDKKVKTLKLKLKARDQDFEDLMADYDALKAEMGERGAMDSDLTEEFCDTLLDLLSPEERSRYYRMPLSQRLPALLNAMKGHNLHGGQTPAMSITPSKLRGIDAHNPFIVAKLGPAVQQTDAIRDGRGWSDPLNFALDGPHRDMEIGLYDRQDKDYPLGRVRLNVDATPDGDHWTPLDQGGDLQVSVNRYQMGSHDKGANAQDLAGIARRLEASIDHLSSGEGAGKRPSTLTLPYLQRLADVLWQLIHESGLQKLRPRKGKKDKDGAAAAGGEGGGGGGDAVDPLAMAGALGAAAGGVWEIDEAAKATMAFLMRSRAGLIRRIWACMEICKACHSLAAKHHGVFIGNRGHKMDVGKYKMSSEDVTAILKEVGSLEDGLSWIVANYFTDNEKHDLGTSPHLYPAAKGVKALPGLIESTDMINARRWTTPPRKASPSRTSRYNHDDFVRRLEDAHMTVLDSRDGKMDGKYFGHDLKALGHLDGPTTSTTAYRRAY